MNDFRRSAINGLTALAESSERARPGNLDAVFAQDAVCDVAYPVNRLRGLEEIAAGLYGPLSNALSHMRRRDEIFIGGRNRRAQGGTWVASVTHYVGNFDAPLFGIPPSGHLVFLRSGEFYRIENGRVVEAKILLDLLDLLRQAGCNPFSTHLGTEMLYPGPATHDGVLPEDAQRGEATLDVVEAMLSDLHVFDPENFESKDQTGANGYWHQDMLWYGPGGIGSSYRWDGFVKDHRASFLRAFPDRKGGNHYCRIGNGNYAAVSGWPSMTMTHLGEYLGVAATKKSLTLRVMDFYRCASGRVMENWVLLDYLDLFNQMGVDLMDVARRTSGDTM